MCVTWPKEVSAGRNIDSVVEEKVHVARWDVRDGGYPITQTSQQLSMLLPTVSMAVQMNNCMHILNIWKRM